MESKFIFASEASRNSLAVRKKYNINYEKKSYLTYRLHEFIYPNLAKNKKFF